MPKSKKSTQENFEMISEQAKLIHCKLNNRIKKLQSFGELVNKSTVTEINELEVEELNTRMENVRPLLTEYEDLYDQFMVFSISEDEVLTSSEFEASLASSMSKAKLIIKHFEKQTAQNQTNNSNPTVTSNNPLCIKLPEISLLTFSGEISEFPNFLERFISCVDRNPNLTDDLKLTYLQSCLKAPASEVLVGLPIVGSNYKVALDLLKDRFQNRRLLIFQQLEKLFEGPKLSRESGLRNFYDLITKHLKTVDSLNFSDAEYKSAIIAYLVKSKSDNRTIVEFSKQFSEEVPKVTQISEFLSERCRLIEDINVCLKKNTLFNNSNNSRKEPVKTFLSTNSFVCPLCKGNHSIGKCEAFLKLSPRERYDKVKELRLCFNCMHHSYKENCTSSFFCKTCGKRHHTLLCFSSPNRGRATKQKGSDSNHQRQESDNVIRDNPSEPIADLSPAPVSKGSTNCNFSMNSEVLLSTAKATAINGRHSSQVRILLDSGSQSNFITESLCRSLNLKCTPINMTVKCLGGMVTQASKMTSISIQSHKNNYQFNVDCLVMKEITDDLPVVRFESKPLDIPPHLYLADESFNVPSRIDVLLGASSYFKLIKPNQFSLGNGLPVMQDTELGWLISGNLPKHFSNINDDFGAASFATRVNHVLLNSKESLNEINTSLMKLWDIDQTKPKSNLSLLSHEEKFCETHFLDTVEQNDEGTLVVSIPFKGNLNDLGESEQFAKNQFFNLERRLSKNPDLKMEYCKQMQEYISMSHMTKVQENGYRNPDHIETLDGMVSTQSIPSYFLPHHCVFKSDSLTTKVRVVFNGSLKTTSGISINDAQINGPLVQDKLFNILIRFRQFEFALTGDIAKMYRMIQIRKAERRFQRIFWRNDPKEPLEIFEINRVTFGTTSASFLATRCLIFLADKFEPKYQKASQVIKRNFYMDDLLYSSQSKEELLLIKEQISHILKNGGFIIRKFLSNSMDLLNNSNTDHAFASIPLGDRSNAKALGISWNSLKDRIFFNFCLEFKGSNHTKRSILSTIARLYDPLGILAPIIVKGKLLLQSLWQQKIDWDQEIPSNLSNIWTEFSNQLRFINEISVPRCLILSNFIYLEIHGFCDASSIAYGACIYIRCLTPDTVYCNLVAAKSRVAPLHTISIPRLELCAAVLLAELMNNVITNLDVHFDQTFYWSDSRVVLNWVNSAPNKYKVFVANRIAVIQELTSSANWRHVASENNPSDLISRGINPIKLINNKFWFSGPSFLNSSNRNCESPLYSVENEPLDIKPSVSLSLLNRNGERMPIFGKFSCFLKLKRVFAYVLRFIFNCKASQGKRRISHLKIEELKESSKKLVYMCQQEVFAEERVLLMKGINLKTSIQSLNPFVDQDNCIRVGGRLGQSEFPFDKKYPLLLPKNHPLTLLIFRYYHLICLHCGPQQLLSIVREYFWPISGKNMAKLVVRNCIICSKANPRFRHPQMGNLPLKRVNVNLPVFYNVGVDYAGPIQIKDRKLRGSKLIKAYICIFICMATKAVHLELVTELSTQAFVDVLSRFISRRGIPFSISSDNAKNFVGARNYLKDLYQFFCKKQVTDSIVEKLSHQQIKWEFINPRSPHEGGLWESAVKSTKFHLTRVLGNTNLNFEDFYTILTKIEAILNSRPLSILPGDTNDLNPLTPGHFLILRPFTALPEHDFMEANPSRLHIFNRMQQIVQHFWKRWSREVVPSYQRRSKWAKRFGDLAAVGNVVLVQEDETPPHHWPLGRIIEVHRGKDEVIRGATIRLSNGSVVKRSVHRICVLPTGSD